MSLKGDPRVSPVMIGLDSLRGSFLKPGTIQIRFSMAPAQGWFHNWIPSSVPSSGPARLRPVDIACPGLWHSYPRPCPRQFVKHFCRTAGYRRQFVELVWAGAWVWMSQPTYPGMPGVSSASSAGRRGIAARVWGQVTLVRGNNLSNTTCL